MLINGHSVQSIITFLDFCTCTEACVSVDSVLFKLDIRFVFVCNVFHLYASKKKLATTGHPWRVYPHVSGQQTWVTTGFLMSYVRRSRNTITLWFPMQQVASVHGAGQWQSSLSGVHDSLLNDVVWGLESLRVQGCLQAVLVQLVENLKQACKRLRPTRHNVHCHDWQSDQTPCPSADVIWQSSVVRSKLHSPLIPIALVIMPDSLGLQFTGGGGHVQTTWSCSAAIMNACNKTGTINGRENINWTKQKRSNKLLCQ